MDLRVTVDGLEGRGGLEPLTSAVDRAERWAKRAPQSRTRPTPYAELCCAKSRGVVGGDGFVRTKPGYGQQLDLNFHNERHNRRGATCSPSLALVAGRVSWAHVRRRG
jgi:hypothetical protein